MSADYSLHVFRSARFPGVVDEAIEFFNGTPVHELPPAKSFVGTGVYALYYLGDLALYAELGRRNQEVQIQPIYVGKAVPQGWRTSRSRGTTGSELYGRLREHARSIEEADGLEIADFRCRFIILGGIESDLVVPVEAELIRRYTPLWNSVVDGFGNHDPGKGRYNQAKSEWDVLHPGRRWADRLTGEAPQLKEVAEKVRRHLGRIPKL